MQSPSTVDEQLPPDLSSFMNQLEEDISSLNKQVKDG